MIALATLLVLTLLVVICSLRKSPTCEEIGQAYLAEVEAKAKWMASAANEDVADILVGEIIAGRRELLTAFCSHGRSFTIHTDIPFSFGIEAVAKEEWDGKKVWMDMEFCSDSVVFDYIRGFVVEAAEKGANFEVYAHSERRHAIFLMAQPCYKARTAE